MLLRFLEFGIAKHMILQGFKFQIELLGPLWPDSFALMYQMALTNTETLYRNQFLVDVQERDITLPGGYSSLLIKIL